jgi:hypothetical protein
MVRTTIMLPEEMKRRATNETRRLKVSFADSCAKRLQRDCLDKARVRTDLSADVKTPYFGCWTVCRLSNGAQQLMWRPFMMPICMEKSPSSADDEPDYCVRPSL